MRALAGFLTLASIALGAFSIANGYRYGQLRDEGWRYSRRNDALLERRVEREQQEIHTMVKAVSIPYFLLTLGLFVGVLRSTPRRKGPIAAIVICVLMLGWTLIVSSAASFDEVYPAWVVATVILFVLQLTTFGSSAPTEKPAQSGS